MSVIQPSKWLTACLYYAEPLENFLVQGVKPYVDVVMQAGIANCFYFQRSWDRGPHIKLWFKGNAEIIDTMLKPNLIEHFEQYFESRPSLRNEPNYPDNFPESKKWLPNNSVHYFELMTPDTSVEQGVLRVITQKQFCASSMATLNSIKSNSGRWTYDDAMSTAIKLHLSFAFAVGMDLAEIHHFFKLLWKQWQPVSAQPNKTNFPNKAKLKKSFKKALAIQKLDLTAFTVALWDSIESGRSLPDDHTDEWIHKNINVNIELGLVQEAGKLSLPPSSQILWTSDLPSSKLLLWNFYALFVDKTNNRLGIQGKDIGYLYYILDQILSDPISSKMKKNTYQTVRAQL